MIKILFVDDEPKVLEGIERMLFDANDEWEMSFAPGGREALDLMEQEVFDVVVSDMRMPGMDGADLLAEVKELHPKTVRFILTGHTDDETAFRSVDLAHQFLSKPCDPEVLQNQIRRAISLRSILNNEGLKTLLSSLNSLPSLPGIYEELLDELKSPEPSLKYVSEIIGRDVAMSAKLLHLVNSAFFGLRNQVNDLTQAASFLGLNTIKSLVLQNHAFAESSEARLPEGFSLDQLSNHSLTVGALAREISECETEDSTRIQEAFMAGVLHDLGKLVLAMNCPEEYGKGIKLTQNNDGYSQTAEVEIFGAGHCEVGAYLLGLWGLPDPIVEAVALHHSPQDCLSRSFNTVTAVHVGNFLAHESSIKEGTSADYLLDSVYLKNLCLEERLPVWKEACRRILEEASHV